MSGKTALIAGGVAIIVAGGAAIAFVAWNNSKTPKPTTRATSSVSTTWGTPRAAVSGVRDSLGLVVYPEMYQQGRMDKQDACAWEGCIGGVDSDGRCTGCPQM